MSARLPARHEMVEQHLRSQIGQSNPGDALESDADLCELFGVSRMTVRQATQRLVAEGLIYRTPGRGTFVARPQLHRHTNTLLSLSADMARRGQTVHSRVLVAHTRLIEADEIGPLRLSSSSIVTHIGRLRLADDVPIAIENVVLPVRFSWLLDLDLTLNSLHQALADHGEPPTHATGTQIAAVAGFDDADLLQVSPGAPLFIENRTIYSAGRPIELTTSRYAGTRFVYHVDLHRAPQTCPRD